MDRRAFCSNRLGESFFSFVSVYSKWARWIRKIPVGWYVLTCSLGCSTLWWLAHLKTPQNMGVSITLKLLCTRMSVSTRTIGSPSRRPYRQNPYRVDVSMPDMKRASHLPFWHHQRTTQPEWECKGIFSLVLVLVGWVVDNQRLLETRIPRYCIIVKKIKFELDEFVPRLYCYLELREYFRRSFRAERYFHTN